MPSTDTLSAVVVPTHSDAILTSLGGYDDICALVAGGPCTLQALCPRPDVTFYFDEEGKMKGLPLNPFATVGFKLLGGELFDGDYLAGNVVVLGFDARRGADLSLPRDVIERFVDVEGLEW